ncbi:phage portal protein [Lelliottia sp. V89_10]|uniref:phage portal protein n=1 Tax=Lelliottia wanjuensis TaxID=3050585 RepID=UPI00249E23C1|nr:MULTISPECIES: phage portal protein [unclassified Lelliottia]MDI3359770.1 phage portal protein [Lelliottia sp. V89_13]MDK9548728.1 phage portal protein [Lelliottia sp. V89_5]MDK9597360.1 phage portal protein [Lelliottia sp. V89_10]
MRWLEDLIESISPGWSRAREQNRLLIRAYEAANPSRTHKAKREGRTANQQVASGGVSLREQARWLDANHDLVIGTLDKLEERVVGPRGIVVEPQPLTRDGKLADKFAKELRRLWAEWSISPDVTGQYSRPVLERLMLRTWLRDGEVFTQLVSGKVSGLQSASGVPFWLEAMEPDFVPLSATNPAADLNQGIYLNEWGRPLRYQVYKSLPRAQFFTGETKDIPAENMLHLKFTRRLHQLRGVSMLAGVLIRISALKEYEDSEMTAARIAAALGMYIKKGDGQSYPTDSGSEEDRELDIQPGIIFDDLRPGEDVGMIKSDRPNANLESFRNGQLRAFSAGVRVSYSSVARDYNGTYSAQRQELVESTDGYQILQDCFVSSVSRRIYRQFLRMAILSGKVTVPRNVDPDSLYNAVYLAPVMPWIDPKKEAEGWKMQIRGGAATEGDWVRASGRNPDDVKRRRKAEIDENKELGLIYDTDPANDKGGSNAQNEQKPGDEPAKDDGKGKSKPGK